MGLLSWFKRAQPVSAPERKPGDLTEAERSTIDAITCLFETGRAELSTEAYCTATVLDDGAGVTYGLHQTTARTALPSVIEGYYAAGGKLGDRSLPDALRLVLSTVGMSPTRLPAEVLDLLADLRGAGRDPEMQRAQREVFERVYWRPTHAAGQLLQLRRPLSYACLYDLSIHSGPPQLDRPLTTGMLAKLRPRFPELPPSKGGGERLWVVRLLETRREFLLSFPDKLRQGTVYRVDALRDLCDDDRWDLETPLDVRIRRPSGRVETHTIGDRPLVG